MSILWNTKDYGNISRQRNLKSPGNYITTGLTGGGGKTEHTELNQKRNWNTDGKLNKGLL